MIRTTTCRDRFFLLGIAALLLCGAPLGAAETAKQATDPPPQVEMIATPPAGEIGGRHFAGHADGRSYAITGSRSIAPRGGGTCVDTATALCLNNGRFRVEVDWREFQGETGYGMAVDQRSDDSGLFWFFDSENWEMLVKVLKGCALNGHYWVFSAATTNVEYTLRVTDTQTNQVKTYFNPLGTAAPAITDTSAFATCP